MRDGRDAFADQLMRLGKTQIWREQRSANEARRSGGEYPRATTMFRKCEIATVTEVSCILPYESKCCAPRARLGALSGAIGALQQVT